MENTRLSEQYFSAVQKFVVFDLGLTLLPVSGQTEASQLITQMVSSEDETVKPNKHQFDSTHLLFSVFQSVFPVPLC